MSRTKKANEGRSPTPILSDEQLDKMPGYIRLARQLRTVDEQLLVCQEFLAGVKDEEMLQCLTRLPQSEREQELKFLQYLRDLAEKNEFFPLGPTATYWASRRFANFARNETPYKTRDIAKAVGVHESILSKYKIVDTSLRRPLSMSADKVTRLCHRVMKCSVNALYLNEPGQVLLPQPLSGIVDSLMRLPDDQKDAIASDATQKLRRKNSEQADQPRHVTELLRDRLNMIEHDTVQNWGPIFRRTSTSRARNQKSRLFNHSQGHDIVPAVGVYVFLGLHTGQAIDFFGSLRLDGVVPVAYQGTDKNVIIKDNAILALVDELMAAIPDDRDTALVEIASAILERLTLPQAIC